MDMVERVAKAIYEDRNGPKCEPWAQKPKGHKDPYRADAKAAIKAMCEATGPMAQEGAEALNPYADEVQAFTDNVEIALDVWQAMTDAALK